MKKITAANPQVKLGAALGEDCGCLAPGDGEEILISSDGVSFGGDLTAALAIYQTANDLAAGGGVPAAVTLDLFLPPDTGEDAIRRLMEQADRAAADLRIAIVGGHTEITHGVTRPLASAAGIAFAAPGAFTATSGGKPGQDVIITKWAGLMGSAVLAAEKRQILRRTLPDSLLDEAAGMMEQVSVLSEARIAANAGASAMHDGSGGGIFAALWELARASHTGIRVDLKKIPLRQETVEICEALDLNPYQLQAGGSLVIAADHGEALCQALREKGILAGVAGVLTEENSCVVINGEDVRYLEPPRGDELFKALAGAETEE